MATPVHLSAYGGLWHHRDQADDGTFKASLQIGRDESVEIDEGAEFPPELCNDPKPPAPSKTKIKAAILAGQTITGARIVPQRQTDDKVIMGAFLSTTSLAILETHESQRTLATLTTYAPLMSAKYRDFTSLVQSMVLCSPKAARNARRHTTLRARRESA